MPAKRKKYCILAEYWVRPSPWEAHTSQLDLKCNGPVLQSQVKLEGVWVQKAAGGSGKAWASPTAYASKKWGNTKLPSFRESFLLALVKSEMHPLILEKKNSLFIPLAYLSKCPTRIAKRGKISTTWDKKGPRFYEVYQELIYISYPNSILRNHISSGERTDSVYT